MSDEEKIITEDCLDSAIGNPENHNDFREVNEALKRLIQYNKKVIFKDIDFSKYRDDFIILIYNKNNSFFELNNCKTNSNIVIKSGYNENDDVNQVNLKIDNCNFNNLMINNISTNGIYIVNSDIKIINIKDIKSDGIYEGRNLSDFNNIENIKLEDFEKNIKIEKLRNNSQIECKNLENINVNIDKNKFSFGTIIGKFTNVNTVRFRKNTHSLKFLLEFDSADIVDIEDFLLSKDGVGAKRKNRLTAKKCNEIKLNLAETQWNINIKDSDSKMKVLSIKNTEKLDLSCKASISEYLCLENNKQASIRISKSQQWTIENITSCRNHYEKFKIINANILERMDFQHDTFKQDPLFSNINAPSILNMQTSTYPENSPQPYYIMRQIAQQANDYEHEMFFFEKEMNSKINSKKLNLGYNWILKIYKKFDYGTSIFAPFLVWIIITWLFSNFYSTNNPLLECLPDYNPFLESMKNGLLFLGGEPNIKNNELAVFFQRLLSFPLIFLFGLAIRNLLRMK